MKKTDRKPIPSEDGDLSEGEITLFSQIGRGYTMDSNRRIREKLSGDLIRRYATEELGSTVQLDIDSKHGNVYPEIWICQVIDWWELRNLNKE